MKIIPTKFEVIDEANVLIAKIEMFDEFCANVEINSVVDHKSWPEVSNAIFECLGKMFKE